MGIVTEGYGGRNGYLDRQILYRIAYLKMVDLGLEEGDVVVDVGAGYCDMDMFMRQRGWFGRYLPVDPSVTPGVDFELWAPTTDAAFFVCLDTIEHLHNWSGMLFQLPFFATKGVVVSTPDADTVDVLAMHPSHVSAQTQADLREHGYMVETFPLGNYAQMLGWTYGLATGQQ